MMEKDSNGRTYWHRDTLLLHISTPPASCFLCPNLGSPAFAPTDVAELAAAAAPGVMMLGQGPLSLLQAEWVERVTADLAEHQLGVEE